MALQNFLLFLMIAGKSLAAADRWNMLGVQDTESFISLRQSLISYNCPGQGSQGCNSCNSYTYCLQVGITAYNLTCSSSQVCQNVGGKGNCLPYTDSAVFDCKCGGGSYIPDYYETSGNRYLQCLEGCAPIPRTCPAGQKFDFLTEKCSTTAATLPKTCPEGGYLLLGCRQGYYCAFPGDVPHLIQCRATEFFVPTRLGGTGCTSEANVKVSPFPCPSGASGAFPDTLECNRFHICSSGIAQGTLLCCPSGEVFSPITMMCIPVTSGFTCPGKHPCDTSSYTYKCSSSTATTSIVVNPALTTAPASGNCVPPTCTTYGAYPDPCNCTQYYWCAGGKATVQKCPSQLLFDSKTRYCTKVADFTGCT